MRLKVKRLVKDLNFSILAGEEALENEISVEMLSRPGVELAGFMDFYEPARLMLIGSKENSFMHLLPYDIMRTRVEDIMMKQPPGVIFSTNVEVDPIFIEFGNKYKVAILKSELRTTPLSSQLYAYLHEKLAPRLTVHGVLLDIYGMGTLIIGKSGIGKSETALELIKRGHILVSDDRVDIYETAPGILVGSAPKILRKYIEVRGIGIVDVVSMFGAGAYRESKKIRLVVELEHWKKDKLYDRIGIETEKITYFDTELAKIIIPILPGRNVATLVESAAMSQKLKYFGYNAALELTEAVAKKASRKQEDDDDD